MDYARALRILGPIVNRELPADLTSPASDGQFLNALLRECLKKYSIGRMRRSSNTPHTTQRLSDTTQNEILRPVPIPPNTPDIAQKLSDTTQNEDLQNGFTVAKPGFGVTEEVQKAQLDLFLQRKKRLSEDRALLEKKFPRGVFPQIHEKDKWYTYCLGLEKLDEKTDAVLTPKLSSACEATAENEEFRLKLMGKPPLLRVVIHLKREDVIQLLQYQKDWLQEGIYTHDNGVWIFALLACLEKPLHRDTRALLRSISSLCSRFRAEVQDPGSDILKSLNIIISIIAYCFDQKDMSDNIALG